VLQNKKLQINPIFSQKNILLHISQTPFLSFFCLSPKQNTQPLRHSDKDRRLMTFFLFFSPFFYFPPQEKCGGPFESYLKKKYPDLKKKLFKKKYPEIPTGKERGLMTFIGGGREKCGGSLREVFVVIGVTVIIVIIRVIIIITSEFPLFLFFFFIIIVVTIIIVIIRVTIIITSEFPLFLFFFHRRRKKWQKGSLCSKKKTIWSP